MLIEIVCAAGMGSFAGLVLHGLRNNKTFIKPKSNGDSFEIGFLFDMLTSAIGAIVMISFIAPTEWEETGMFIFRVLTGASLGESLLLHLDLRKEKTINNYVSKIDQDLEEEVILEDEDETV